MNRLVKIFIVLGTLAIIVLAVLLVRRARRLNHAAPPPVMPSGTTYNGAHGDPRLAPSTRPAPRPAPRPAGTRNR